jgi:hypothetical protein
MQELQLPRKPYYPGNLRESKTPNSKKCLLALAIVSGCSGPSTLIFPFSACFLISSAIVPFFCFVRSIARLYILDNISGYSEPSSFSRPYNDCRCSFSAISCMPRLSKMQAKFFKLDSVSGCSGPSDFSLSHKIIRHISSASTNRALVLYLDISPVIDASIF